MEVQINSIIINFDREKLRNLITFTQPTQLETVTLSTVPD